MTQVSKENLVNIINEAVSEYGNSDNISAKSKMLKFSGSFFDKVQKDPQLSLFDAEFPSSEDVKNARQLCNCLAEYKEYLNVCVDDENAQFSEQSYRNLYHSLQLNKKYISADNMSAVERLESVIRYNIPEFQTTEKISKFNRDAIDIINKKKKCKRAKGKNPDKYNAYQKYADYLFKEMSENMDILKVEADELKLSLYENCLGVVDCLSDKYNKSTKFEFKKRLYDAIARTAKLLGDETKANKAIYDKNRFEKAKEKALHHVSDYHKAQKDIKFQRKNDWEYS